MRIFGEDVVKNITGLIKNVLYLNTFYKQKTLKLTFKNI